MHFQEGSRKKLILSSKGKGLQNGACAKHEVYKWECSPVSMPYCESVYPSWRSTCRTKTTRDSCLSLCQNWEWGAIRICEDSTANEMKACRWHEEAVNYICKNSQNQQVNESFCSWLTKPNCNRYSCIWTTPANTTLIPWDDQNLTTNTTKKIVISDTSAKCEYICNRGYILQNGTCLPVPKNWCWESPFSCRIWWDFLKYIEDTIVACDQFWGERFSKWTCKRENTVQTCELEYSIPAPC